MRRTTLLYCLVPLALTACSEQQTNQAQQLASAAIGQAGQTLLASSAPLQAIKQQASEALGQAQGRVEQMGQENAAVGLAVDVLKQTTTNAKAAWDWQQLDKQVGKYPADIGLYEKGLIAEQLKKLLGDKYPVFLTNMAVSSPLQKDQLLYTSGNKAHEGGSEMAWLVIDQGQKQIEVGLIEAGKQKIYRTGPSPLYQPKDIRTLTDNLGG